MHNSIGTPVLGAVPIASCPLTAKCCGGGGGDGDDDENGGGDQVTPTAAKLHFDVFGTYLNLGITLAISAAATTYDPPAGAIQSQLTALYK